MLVCSKTVRSELGKGTKFQKNFLWMRTVIRATFLSKISFDGSLTQQYGQNYSMLNTNNCHPFNHHKLFGIRDFMLLLCNSNSIANNYNKFTSKGVFKHTIK